MAALKIKLVKSWAGRPGRHRRTLDGLGLYKIDDERLLPDTAAVRGMVRQVIHLVSCESVQENHVPRSRHPRTAAAAK